MITISEAEVWFFRLIVLLLHTITVAQALIKSAAKGFPTILLLHTIVTSFHARSVHITSNIYITPAGVQGTNHV
jgi:hypothetical protein